MDTFADGRPVGMSGEEWEARCDLAAAYRLCALYGWTDLNNTHISARLPGTDDSFLLNPFGMFFEEITASSLIVVDRDPLADIRALRSMRMVMQRGGVVPPPLAIG